MSDQPNGGSGSGDGGGAVGTLTKKDFTSDQEVRWCPGCGDYAILSTVQAFMPELGIDPDNTVFVSGIGCSGRFTYYMDTYGVHGIHGRAPALASGIATARPELSVWVITGDGDGLSIGGNHLFNPIALALGAEATFVARTMDNDRKHLSEVLRQAAAYKGSAFVEIYQNCNVFNDGAFELLREKPQGQHNQIRLEDDKPVIFDEGNRCVSVGENGRLVITETANTPEENIVVFDAQGRPSLAFALAHLSSGPSEPTCIGVFRDVERPVYGEAMTAQIEGAIDRLGPGSIDKLLHAGDTWTVS